MSRNAEQKKRLEWLDFGKAMGILVVLAVHAGCSLGALTYYGGMFYMPIFFFAAGYTFRRKEGESYGTFLWKKAKRLLIPYFGTSDCPAIIRPCEDFFAGEGDYDHTSCDIGITYHGMNYPEQAGDGIKAAAPHTMERRFANLKMENGVIEFPQPAECEFIQVIKVEKKGW